MTRLSEALGDALPQGMRLISTLDWAEAFESVSLVDAALRAESCFAQMDFPTRDRYRHAIEDLARGSGRTELDVARCAIAAATPPIVGPTKPAEACPGREHDPGYYLIASGQRAFEKALGGCGHGQELGACPPDDSASAS